jgi:hypothetical protein
MSAKKADFHKMFESLSGKDRARLIVRDIMEELRGNGLGFLSELEKRSLALYESHHTKEEADKYRRVYMAMAFVSRFLIQSYLQFRCSFEVLQHYNLLFAQIPLANGLASRIKKHVKSDAMRKEMLEMTRFFNPLSKEGSIFALEDTERFLTSMIRSTYRYSSDLKTLIRVIEKCVQYLGDEILYGENFLEICEFYLDEVMQSIKRHNDMIDGIVAELAKNGGKQRRSRKRRKKGDIRIEDCHIPEPEFDGDSYNGWVKDIFEGESGSAIGAGVFK